MPVITSKDLAADILDKDGPFAQWVDRERHVYIAHHGRDGTLEGFQEHCFAMLVASPTLRELALKEYITAVVEAYPE